MCCTYLAFKVEEYNVSVDQFVHVLAPQLRDSVAEFVLSHEVRYQPWECSELVVHFSLPHLIWQLLLLKKLKFHLTVHSPFRPLEGFIIDIKVILQTTGGIYIKVHLRKDIILRYTLRLLIIDIKVCRVVDVMVPLQTTGEIDH